MYINHKYWNKLFDQYKFNIDNIYSVGEVYPPKELVFRIFEMDVNYIKILLLGQEPYNKIIHLRFPSLLYCLTNLIFIKTSSWSTNL